MALLLALTLLPFLPPIQAEAAYEDYDAEQNGIRYSVREGEIWIERILSKEEKIRIPEQIGGMKVTRLNQVMLEKEVKTLYIPKTVKDISVPTTCYIRGSLNKIVVDKANPKYMSKGGIVYSKDRKTLIWCPMDLTKVKIPKTVTRIGTRAFHASHLKKITIPDTVTSIGTGAFSTAFRLQEVRLSKRVKNIPENAFSDCKKLKKITIPAGVVKIGTGAFNGCYRLKEVSFEQGSRLRYVNRRAFLNCALNHIELPNTVERIGRDTFLAIDELKSITIPPKVAKINESVFFTTGGIREVIISGEGTKINKNPYGISDHQRGDVTVVAKMNSHAYNWAKENGYKVRAL